MLKKQIRQLGSRSVIYVVGDMINKGLQFALLPIYARYLTPADFGILSLATAISSFLTSVYRLGSGAALTRYYFEYRSDPIQLRQYIGSLWIFITVSNLLLTLLLLWLGSSVPNLFASVPFDPYMQVVIWTVFFLTISFMPLIIFRVRGQAFRYLILSVAQLVLVAVGTLYLVVWREEGALGSLVGRLWGNLGVFVIATLFILQIVGLQLRFKPKLLMPAVAYGLPLILHTLSVWILNVSDRIILERFVSLDDLGLYSLAYQFGTGLVVIFNAIAASWVPFFYDLIEKRGWPAVARFETYRAGVSVVVSLAMAVTARELIMIIAAPAYYPATAYVPVICLGYAIWAMSNIPFNVLTYEKATRIIPFCTLGSAAVSIGLNLLLVPRYGTLAAAVNTGVSFLVLLLTMGWAAHRVQPVRFEYGRIGKLLIAGLITYALVSLILFPNLWLTLGVKLVATVVCFAVTLWALRFFTDTEQKVVQEQIQKVRQ